MVGVYAQPAARYDQTQNPAYDLWLTWQNKWRSWLFDEGIFPAFFRYEKNPVSMAVQLFDDIFCFLLTDAAEAMMKLDQ